MTTCYQWFSFPSEFSVHCPKCKSEARCCKTAWFRKTEDWGTTDFIISGQDAFEGHVSCLKCSFTGRIAIHWPQDAYWKCEVKGKILWAWSLEHAKVLLSYIQSSDRDEKSYPGYLASLLHLPTHFKLASNREAATRSLNKLITSKSLRKHH